MFTNVEVYFPLKHAAEAETEDLSWNFFVGFRIDDERYGRIGTVTDVDTSTVNTLFVIEREDEELLIPAQEEFILEIDRENKTIAMQLPEGLLDLESLEED